MDYQDLILDGYINNRDFLPGYFYRKCKDAEKDNIESEEFFLRSINAIEDLEKRWYERFNYSDEMSISHKPNKNTFSVPLLHFTGKGEHLDYRINLQIISVIKRGILSAVGKIQAEGQKKEPTELTHRVFCWINYYKSKASYENRLTGADLEGKRRQALYTTIQSKNSKSFKPATKKELEKVIENLNDFPSAKKAAVNDLSQLQ